jgi:hypothetical protein
MTVGTCWLSRLAAVAIGFYLLAATFHNSAASWMIAGGFAIALVIGVIKYRDNRCGAPFACTNGNSDSTDLHEKMELAALETQDR